jgi:hypothetical protein
MVSFCTRAPGPPCPLLPHPFPYFLIDHVLHPGKISPYVPIVEPEHFHAAGHKPPGPFQIVGFFRGIEMLAAVDFYHQPGFGAVKIHNVSPDGFLPKKTDGILLQKLEPQMPFFGSHVFSEMIGKVFEVTVSGGFVVHG